jgi:hypothetical protein
MDRPTLIVLLFSTLGCVPIDGGAVEASWVVVTPDGRTISDCACTCARVAKVRLKLEPLAGGADPCVAHTSCQFSCNLQSGATRFDIPAGSYAISLVPVGANGEDITSGEAGSNCGAAPGTNPIVREVVKGQVTSLDASIVLADCAPECGGSDDTRVCTR